MYAHISKPLQEKTAPFNFLRRMRHFTEPKKERKIVVKNEIETEKFDWEHEPYFNNRISALTLSHFSTADHVSRNVLTNDVDPKKKIHDLKIFNWRIQIITEALVSYIFGLNVESWCTEELHQSDNCHVIQPFDAIQTESAVRALMSTPRPAVSLPSNLINDLHRLVRNYCHKTEKRVFTPTDLQLYGVHTDQIVAQIVKPALFELVLAAAISAYIFVIYNLSAHAHRFILKAKVN